MISKMMMAVLFLFFTFTGFAATGEEGKTYEAHFLDKMIMHHKDGVEMAEMGVKKASNSDIKQMSEKMATDQKKEITQMEKWRNDLYKNVSKAKEIPPQMEMSQLQSSSGKDFDKSYLEMMSKHHESGITMFEEAKTKANNSQIREFAMKGIKNQNSEKEHMEHMKSSM